MSQRALPSNWGSHSTPLFEYGLENMRGLVSLLCSFRAPPCSLVVEHIRARHGASRLRLTIFLMPAVRWQGRARPPKHRRRLSFSIGSCWPHFTPITFLKVVIQKYVEALGAESPAPYSQGVDTRRFDLGNHTYPTQTSTFFSRSRLNRRIQRCSFYFLAASLLV